MAADLSARLGFIDEAVALRIKALVAAAKLPVTGPDLGEDRYIDLMRVDKKAEGGDIRFVLLNRLGQAFMTSVPDAELRATLRANI